MKNLNKIDKKVESKNIEDVLNEISVTQPVSDLPDTALELINTYGTYEIQNTADTKNQYPAIAQGFNPKIVKRDCENRHDGSVWKSRDK